jgi:DNA-binding transcriptional LysR family regulator
MHLSAIRWLETAGIDGRAPRKPAFAANSVLAMKYAIRAGIGVGLIPDYLTGEESELVPVLEEAKLPTVPVYFAYPEELKSAKKIQVFRDFMIAKARQWKF